jgi:hypothetical protein
MTVNIHLTFKNFKITRILKASPKISDNPEFSLIPAKNLKLNLTLLPGMEEKLATLPFCGKF